MGSLGDKQEVGWDTEQLVWQLQLAGHRVSLPRERWAEWALASL